MPTPNFNALRERLLRAGIAPRHVRRYVRELRDHFEDIVAEEISLGKSERDAKSAATLRLGDEETLAAELLKSPELKSLAARFPLLMFGLGPVLMLSIVVIAALLIEGGFLFWHKSIVEGAIGGPASLSQIEPGWIKSLAFLWNGAATYALPVLILALLCAIGFRQRSEPKWILLGLIVISVFGGFHQLDMSWSDGTGPSELSLGFGLAPPFPQEMILSGLLRTLFNGVLAGSLFWWWSRRVPELA